MSSAKKDWILALGYVALIYATLEVARIPLQFLRSHNLLRFSLGVLFSTTTVCVVWILVKNHGQDFWRFALLGAVGLAYVMTAQTVQTPEEKIHFFEYGLVGILFSARFPITCANRSEFMWALSYWPPPPGGLTNICKESRRIDITIFTTSF